MKSPHTSQRRSAARLAAVQALYEIDVSGNPVESVLEDFSSLRGKALITSDEDESVEIEEVLARPNANLFSILVRGVMEQPEHLDALVDQALSGDAERLESLLRSILRAATFELTARPDVPVPVVISEYLDITHAFYSGPESKLVNAVLDHIAHELHAGKTSGDAR